MRLIATVGRLLVSMGAYLLALVETPVDEVSAEDFCAEINALYDRLTASVEVHDGERYLVLRSCLDGDPFEERIQIGLTGSIPVDALVLHIFREECADLLIQFPNATRAPKVGRVSCLN